METICQSLAKVAIVTFDELALLNPLLFLWPLEKLSLKFLLLEIRSLVKHETSPQPELVS